MIEELKREAPIIEKLRKEQQELIAKATKLSNFRGTAEWDKLTTAEKVLLDTQLSVMNTYIEILINRIILIQEKEAREHAKKIINKAIKINIEKGE